MIIEHFLLALQNYLTQYACKGAASTEDFIQTYRLLLNESDESTTVKNLCQRLLLKLVGFVDVPEAAADFINTGGKLVRCTRNFNCVGLSGYRIHQDQVNVWRPHDKRITTTMNCSHIVVTRLNTIRELFRDQYIYLINTHLRLITKETCYVGFD